MLAGPPPEAPQLLLTRQAPAGQVLYLEVSSSGLHEVPDTQRLHPEGERVPDLVQGHGGAAGKSKAVGPPGEEGIQPLGKCGAVSHPPVPSMHTEVQDVQYRGVRGDSDTADGPLPLQPLAWQLPGLGGVPRVHDAQAPALGGGGRGVVPQDELQHADSVCDGVASEDALEPPVAVGKLQGDHEVALTGVDWLGGCAAASGWRWRRGVGWGAAAGMREGVYCGVAGSPERALRLHWS
jgi:hypothetical protein